MRTTVKIIAGLAAATVIGAPAAGLAYGAGRPAGTSYVGQTATGSVALTLSRDGRQVRSAQFAYGQKCTDGDTLYDYDGYSGIPIGANRRFHYSYRSDTRPVTKTPGATFSYTQAISGLVNRRGTRIVGSARATYTFTNPAGGSYTCDTGTVRFAAAD